MSVLLVAGAVMLTVAFVLVVALGLAVLFLRWRMAPLVGAIERALGIEGRRGQTVFGPARIEYGLHPVHGIPVFAGGLASMFMLGLLSAPILVVSLRLPGVWAPFAILVMWLVAMFSLAMVFLHHLLLRTVGVSLTLGVESPVCLGGAAYPGHEVWTGDPDFDRAIHVTGPALEALAILSAPVRAAAHRVIAGGAVTRDGIHLRWPADTTPERADTDTGAVLLLADALHPGEPTRRLAEAVLTESVEEVRLRCMQVLLDEAPEDVETRELRALFIDGREASHMLDDDGPALLVALHELSIADAVECLPQIRALHDHPSTVVQLAAKACGASLRSRLPTRPPGA